MKLGGFGRVASLSLRERAPRSGGVRARLDKLSRATALTLALRAVPLPKGEGYRGS
jgi:hypothetical protein